VNAKETAVEAIMMRIKENKRRKKFQHEDDLRAVNQHMWTNSNTKGRYRRRR